MALIKCNECGHMVSDKATECPNCGCPIEKKLICEECGAELKETDKICSSCGCPNTNYRENYKSNQEEVQEKKLTPSTTSGKKVSVALPMVIGIVVYIVLTAILSNLFNEGDTFQERIENDLIICASVASVVSWFVAKSIIDRVVCTIAIVVVSAIVAAAWKELMLGGAVIAHITNICAIIAVAIRRKDHTDD